MSMTCLPRRCGRRCCNMLPHHGVSTQLLISLTESEYCTVTSSTQTKSRTVDNLPWSELETPEGQEHLLVNHVDFASLSFFCPTSTTPYDLVHALATKLTLPHASPLFKQPSSTPSSPVIAPYPSPPTSRRQNTPSPWLLNNDPGAVTANTGPEEFPRSELVAESHSQSTSVLASRPSTTSNRPLFTSALPALSSATNLTPPAPALSLTPQPKAVPPTMETSNIIPLDTCKASEGDGTPADVRDAEESPGQDKGPSSGTVGGAPGNEVLGKRKRMTRTTGPPTSTRQLRSSVGQLPTVTTSTM